MTLPVNDFDIERDFDQTSEFDDVWDLAKADAEAQAKERGRVRDNRSKKQVPESTGSVSQGALEHDEEKELQRRQPWRRDVISVHVRRSSCWHWTHWVSANAGNGDDNA